MKEDISVSIIIPVYNRVDLISETIKSLISQTYNNWECIIIDDGSNDGSVSLISGYCLKDDRFIFIERSVYKKKGANTCRNIGLKYAKGDYTVFFDSDDIMKPNHLELKLQAIKTNRCDYVITKTLFFNDDKGNLALEKNYDFKSKDITPLNYINQKINWLTYDVCIKTSLAKSIRFNESLQSGQEYNYFAKLVLKSTNAVFVNKVVTLRRAHQNSIQSELRKDKDKLANGYFTVYWVTYIEICDTADKKIRQSLIYKCYKTLIKNKKLRKDKKGILYMTLIKEFGFKGVYYSLRLICV